MNVFARNAKGFSAWKSLCQLVGATVAAAWISTAAMAQPAFSNAVSLGIINLAVLDEPSGIAASRNNEGVLWTHNDSGDMARVFALDFQGRLLGTYKLPGARNYDYEDIAVGPGPVTNVLYVHVGDIGDNFSERSSIIIYQFPEPAVYLRQASNPPTVNVKGLRTLTLTYPDGPHNAETLMVDAVSGDVFIATKETNVSRIYTVTKAQMDAGAPITLAFVRTVDVDMASAGDISPTGREIIIRSGDYARLWTRAPGQSVGAALGGVPAPIPVVGQPAEPKGEGIAFDAAGSGYFTMSDVYTAQPLYYFGRSNDTSRPPPRMLAKAGATWRYLDTGTNLGAAWRADDYNDAAWKTGDGEFGYGDGDEKTTVGFGPKSTSRYITTYFRKTFVITNPPAFSRLEFKLIFDDGVAAYLNGTLIALANLGSNATATNLASAAQEDLEDTWFTFPVSTALLVSGTNTLAVEVHQAAANSTDLSFDAQLMAFESTPPRILSAAREPDGTFHLACAGSDDTLGVEASTNLTAWSVVGRFPLTNGIGAFLDTQSAGNAQRFYRLSR